MRLYDLAQRYLELSDLAFEESDEEGLIDKTFVAMLANLEGNINNKLAAMCRIVRELEATEEAAKVEAAMLSEKRRCADAHVGRIKRYMMESLESLNVLKIKVDDVFTVAIQASPVSLNVVDFDAVPDLFDKPIIRQIDTVRIKEALTKGISVEGCELTRGKHVRIR